MKVYSIDSSIGRIIGGKEIADIVRKRLGFEPELGAKHLLTQHHGPDPALSKKPNDLITALARALRSPPSSQNQPKDMIFGRHETTLSAVEHGFDVFCWFDESRAAHGYRLSPRGKQNPEGATLWKANSLHG